MTASEDTDGPSPSGGPSERLAAFEEELAEAAEAEAEAEAEAGDDENETIGIETSVESELDSEADTFRAAGLDPSEYRVEE